MARIPYRIVDVFTERPFGGNGICVVLGECRNDMMQTIARQMNLSETTFPTITGADSYSMRIFTSTNEIPFVGSASLATAWTLGPGTWTQSTSGATVTITATGHDAQMSQPMPTFEPLTITENAARVANVDSVDEVVRSTIGGLNAVIARTSCDLASVDIDRPAIEALLVQHHASTFAICNEPAGGTIQVRSFVPHHALFEIPGHGSLSGSLGVLAHTQWNAPIDLTVRQGHYTGTPCRIDVHADPDNLKIGGPLHLIAEGEFLV